MREYNFKNKIRGEFISPFNTLRSNFMKKEEKDLRYYAKVHSIESLLARLPLRM